MEQTMSSKPLKRVAYFPQDDGTAIVYLRENIEKSIEENQDGTSYESWLADEVHGVTSLPESEVETRFDELWVKFANDERSYSDRLAYLEAIVDDLTGVVLEGGE